MKVYLDNCALQRPLDDKTQLRIALESEAIIGVISLCESKKIGLISSDILVFEIYNNPNRTRKQYGSEVLNLATVFVS